MHFLTNREVSKKIVDVDSQLNFAPASNMMDDKAKVAVVSIAMFEEMCTAFRQEPIPLDDENIKHNLGKIVPALGQESFLLNV